MATFDHIEPYLGALLVYLWIGGIAHDAIANRIGWLAADVLAPPIGMVRGLAFLLG